MHLFNHVSPHLSPFLCKNSECTSRSGFYFAATSLTGAAAHPHSTGGGECDRGVSADVRGGAAVGWSDNNGGGVVCAAAGGAPGSAPPGGPLCSPHRRHGRVLWRYVCARRRAHRKCH